MDENYKPKPVFAALTRNAAGTEDYGAPFFDPVQPADFPQAMIRFRNQEWAGRVGLGDLDDEQWRAHFARFEPLPDNLSGPIALRYHGHQFRTYNHEIGDGRGFLFAQVCDEQARLLDLGTKGSGQTPYSRFGDGRLTLKGGIREILASEMLEALGVYSSKTFSVIETGEKLYRNDEPSPTRSCVLVRLSHSHVRFGAFQRFAYEKDDDALRELSAYCVANFYPTVKAMPVDEQPVDLFEHVVAQTARLAAQWMAAGFVHGVLNTDNLSITGESFDYGPWRFTPVADPTFTAAYFDQTGLYAFGRQAEACAWNLAQLGGALSRIAQMDALNAALQRFGDWYEQALSDTFFARLGLRRRGSEDPAFLTTLLRWLTQNDVPFEQFMFDWFCRDETRAMRSRLAPLYGEKGFQPIREALAQIEPDQPERLDHPYFKGAEPCAMLIDEVEAIWAAIADNDDWSVFETKLKAITQMREAYGFEASRFSPEIRT